ncbi:S8 family peptidase [Shimia marina]|nr:S8 family peptidase [Shimia marina]
MPRKILLLTTVLLAPFLLAGCGGGEEGDDSDSSSNQSGSGGSSSLPITDSTTLLTSFIDSLDPIRARATRLIRQDSRYTRQTAPDGRYVDKNSNGRFDSGIDVELGGNPLSDAGIHYAHAAGLTGAGQVIAFSDNGFLTSHEAFSGRAITRGSGLAVADHGTFVASIAAGNSDDMIGVAPAADLIFGSFDSLSQLRATAESAEAAGAVALNNSWGFSNTRATRSDYNNILGTSSGRAYLNALKSYADEGIVVFSVPNNSNFSNTGLMPALPLFEPSLEQSWIAVVNGVPETSGDDVVGARRVSEPCLEAAAWCLSANGSWTSATANSSGSYGFGTGTSYAAPTVSGALALLAEAFPNMTHQQLRVRLLASADNTFDGFTTEGSVELAPGFEHNYSEEWGHGFLDVAAALLPIGRATATMENGTVLDMSKPLVVAGSASGDAVTRALAKVQIQSTDTLSASFAVNAGQLVATRQADPLFSTRDLLTIAHTPSPTTAATAFFGTERGLPVMLGADDINLTLYHGQSSGTDALGFGLSRGFDLGRTNLQLSTSYGADTAALLSEWNGGSGGALAAMDMTLSTALTNSSRLSLAMGYAYGQESSDLGQSADVLLNATALSYAHDHVLTANDALSLSLSLPAAIASGSTSLSLPVATHDGATRHQDVRIDLAPRSREVRLALTYHRPLTRRTNIGISLAHAQNRGHIADAEETALLLGLRTRF